MENGTTEQVPWSREEMFLNVADLCAGNGLPAPESFYVYGNNIASLCFRSFADLTLWAEPLAAHSVIDEVVRSSELGPIRIIHAHANLGGWSLPINAYEPATDEETAELEAREAAQRARELVQA